MKNRYNLFLGTLAVIAMTQSAHAAPATWNGSPTDATWVLDTNWSATPIPGTGDTATFNNAGGAVDTIDLGAGVTIGNILFDTSAAAAYTIGSGAVNSQTLTLNDSGAITASSAIAANQIFNAALVIGTDATAQSYSITNSSATNLLTFAGAITGGTGGTAGAKILNVTTGALTNGSIFMSGAITDGGADSLALAFAPVAGNVQINMGNVGSAYSGGTSVASNVRLFVNAGAGAGLGTGDVTVATGGQVYLASAGTYTSNFAISGVKWGAESTALGAIRIGSTGPNTITGDVALNANAGISVDSGRAATITGDITGALFNLDKSSSAAGTGSLLTLTGTNDYGTTTITRGVISFAKQASLYNSTNSKWIKDYIDVESGAGLALGVGDSASGYWDAAGVTAFLGASQMGASTTTDGFKTGSLIGFDTTNATDGTFTYGAIGNITSTNGVVKLGTGTLVLDGVNTYTGPTAVEGGTLTLSNANPLTIGATSVSAGTLALTDANAVQNSALTLKNGATLQLRDNSATTFNSSGVVTLNSVSAQIVTLDVGNNGSGTDNTLSLANGISYAGPPSGIGAGTYTTQINVTGANGYALSVPSVTFGNGGSYASGSPRNYVLSLNATSASVAIGAVTLTGEGSRTTVALTLDGTSLANKITGAISMPAGRPLTKKGSGTWTLSGTNTYTGATAVTVGTLALVGGSQASPITVSSGATLGFTLGFPTTSTSTVAFSGLTAKVAVTGTPVAATLMTASSITGTPVLDPALPGYVLAIEDGGTTLKLKSTSGSSYSTWASTNGVPGQAANLDHDNDGVSNGVEYFIGGPTGPTTGFTALPSVTTVGGISSITWVKGPGYTGNYPADFVVETSTTLAAGSWMPESSPGTVSISGSNVTYTFPAGPVKTFARLKVTGP